jgi:secondary thiamine-phosphate synthase enzyme
MRQSQFQLRVRPEKQGLVEITDAITGWLGDQSIDTGLLTVFIRHTSASLLIQENVSPDALHDLARFMMKLVPEDEDLYRHIEEGPDDMPAHIKGALTQTHLSVPISHGQLMLGRYQGVFLFEHRRSPRDREVLLHLMGS